jgi:methyl-accepting chemotaxis protein
MTNNLRMGHKLWLSVLAIIILLVSVVGFAGYRSSKSQAQADAVIRELAARVESALKWQGLTETNAARTQAMIVSSDPSVEAEFKDVIAATSAQISQVQKSLEAMNLTEADKAQMAKIAVARSAMLDLRKKATHIKSEGRNDEAIALVKQSYNPAVAAYLQSLRDFVDLQQKYAVQRQSELGADRMRTVQLAAVMVALVLLGIGVGAYFLIRSIEQPLAQAQTLAQRIAAGDLSAQESVARGDEFGDLLRALYAMSESLGRMVHQVRQSTDSIATASAEIAQGNHDLSARTEQASSNLQQTAAAMEQFTSTIGQSAQSAQQASSLANGAASVARKGGDVVSQVVSTMEEIQHSSSKIADIIGVIDGIAFQTNILALNAAVEAARAGEQGRGFAVVASEVRSLAGRSAEAAKEIKQLIGVSVQKVEAGSGLVQQAGSTMQEIVQSVQRVTDMIGEITAASAEQSSGIAQVNQAVGHLDQMTQQNAALVEESTAAAQSLREQAEQLAQAVSQFKVSGVADTLSAPRRPTPVPAPAKHVAAPKAAARPLQGKAAAAAAPRLASARPAPAPGTAAASASARPAARANGDEWESF